MKYYSYYLEAYTAVLGGMLGEYEIETENEDGQKSYETVYGLKAYFPLAKGFDYSHYDDFGVGRSYGYKRRHLGHDMMGLIGTPTGIICRIANSNIEKVIGNYNNYNRVKILFAIHLGLRYISLQSF